MKYLIPIGALGVLYLSLTVTPTQWTQLISIAAMVLFFVGIAGLFGGKAKGGRSNGR